MEEILQQLSNVVTPRKFNSLPLQIGLPKRKVIFQPSFFRGYVKFRGCKYPIIYCTGHRVSNYMSSGGRMVSNQQHVCVIDLYGIFMQFDMFPLCSTMNDVWWFPSKMCLTFDNTILPPVFEGNQWKPSGEGKTNQTTHFEVKNVPCTIYATGLIMHLLHQPLSLFYPTFFGMYLDPRNLFSTSRSKVNRLHNFHGSHHWSSFGLSSWNSHHQDYHILGSPNPEKKKTSFATIASWDRVTAQVIIP